MECPSCHHRQEEALECAACGIVIAKADARAREIEEAREQADGPGWRPHPNHVSVAAGLAVVLFVVALGAALLRKAAEPEPEVEPVAEVVIEDPNPVARARRATVGVESAWAKGAGFIVNEACQVITSAQLVDPRDERQKIAERRERAESERRSWQKRKKQAREKIQHGAPASRAREKRNHETAYHRTESAQQKRAGLDAEARDLWLKGDEIYVTLPEGTRVQASQSFVSSRRDVAILWLPEHGCSYLDLARTEGTPPKTQVYAVGMSGRNSRIFRARTTEMQDDRKPYLALDRWMGGGSLGGPVVNPRGSVIGVVTRPKRRPDGARGYAVPIEEVWTELGHHLEVPLAGN